MNFKFADSIKIGARCDQCKWNILETRNSVDGLIKINICSRKRIYKKRKKAGEESYVKITCASERKSLNIDSCGPKAKFFERRT